MKSGGQAENCKYSLALNFIQDHSTDFLNKTCCPSPWCVMAMKNFKKGLTLHFRFRCPGPHFHP